MSLFQSSARRSFNARFILILTMAITHQQFYPVLAMNEISSSTTAFTLFNPSSKTRRVPTPISDELGTSPTFQYRLFDPLNLATEANFAQYREAELKHGRIAMLAVLGNVLPGLVIRQQEQQEGWSVLAPPQSPILLSVSQDLAFRDVPIGLKAIAAVPSVGWLQIIVAVGVLETMVFVQRSRKDMPGDYGTGYFGLRDKGLHERSLQSELENGRLAMIAFLAQVLIELLTGKTPVDMLSIVLSWKEY